MVMRRSAFLTAALASEAIGFLKPTISELAGKNRIERPHMQIVVLDASTEVTDDDGVVARPPTAAEALVYEELLGDPGIVSKGGYDVFAHRKAAQILRSGASSSLEMLHTPAAYHAGDFPHGGGVRYEGIIVGVSGVQWWMDQAIAQMIAALIHGFCLDTLQTRIVGNKSVTFIPEL